MSEDPSDDDLAARLQNALGDDYRVERRLGSGGFAVVFTVRDLKLKRNLAVKVISPDLVQSRSIMERFRREAEMIAQLSHPNIVPLHFVGQKDDLVYLVMQQVDGGTLADRLKREGALPVDHAARILSEMADALAHAHKRGIVHRDIKPENVLLDAETGRALLSDFGIARSAEAGSLTATGMVVGTIAYLSPEQAAGERGDERSDIYALGVVAYEVLSGRLPYSGRTPAAVLMNRLERPPTPLTELRSDISDTMALVVDQCMVMDPNHRLSDAGDVARMLKGSSPVSSPHAARAPSGRERTRITARNLGLGLIALMTIGTLAAVAARKRNTSGRKVMPTLQVTSSPTVTSAPATNGAASVDSQMIRIPAGTYRIGSNSGPAESRPEHSVSLERFAIDAHEVTVGDYEEFVRAGKAPAPWKSRASLLNDRPVTGVTLAEAMSYCTWRNPDGGRLPNEEEWEAAARGTDSRMYPWGNKWDPAAANTGSRVGSPIAAGSYTRGKSPLGVDDLIGNVWEWTSSQFRSYGASSDTGKGLYVIRGGAYNSYDRVSTSIFRGRAQPDASRNDLAATGFRCAMSEKGE